MSESRCGELVQLHSPDGGTSHVIEFFMEIVLDIAQHLEKLITFLPYSWYLNEVGQIGCIN